MEQAGNLNPNLKCQETFWSELINKMLIVSLAHALNIIKGLSAFLEGGGGQFFAW